MPLTGKRGRPEEDGIVCNSHGIAEMSAKQQWVTGLMGLLMLVTILMMPTHTTGKTNESNRAGGLIAQASEVRTELPQEQVRDLAYN